jgi:hypothetical protein
MRSSQYCTQPAPTSRITSFSLGNLSKVPYCMKLASAWRIASDAVTFAPRRALSRARRRRGDRATRLQGKRCDGERRAGLLRSESRLPLYETTIVERLVFWLK